MPKHLFYLKNDMIISWDSTGKRKITRHQAHWAVLVLGFIWLFALHTRFNRALRFVFGFVSENISEKISIDCTQTAFFIEKQKDLGDFQKFFQSFLRRLYRTSARTFDTASIFRQREFP